MSHRRWWRRIGVALIAIGIVVCLTPLAYLAYGNWQQSQINQQWQKETQHAAKHPAVTVPTTAPSGSQKKPGSAGASSALLFAIRVPKIGYWAAVQQGVSTSVLYAGPGHYPQTVLPGQAGTVGVAAHNAYWIKFGQLGAGDQVELQTQTQTYSYTVTRTQVVSPSDVSVLASNPQQHQLVLTTCWPLWAGALARQRLVIFATQNPG